MNTRLWLAPVLGLLTAAGAANAWYRSPGLKIPLGYAPDACGPGFYTVCSNGYAFGPNYCVYPPCQPFNGLLPPDKLKQLQDIQGRGINHQGEPQARGGQGGPAYTGGPPGYPPQAPFPGAPGVAQNSPTPGYAPNMPGPGYAPIMPAPGYAPNGVPLPYPGYSPPMPVQPPPAFPSHPFARGPRDFFMWSDVMQDRIARAQRPSLVP